MDNREIHATQNYHAGTKHPNGYLMDPSHYYHPSLEPLKFKIYQGTELTALPQPKESLGMPALQAIAAKPFPPGEERIPTIYFPTLPIGGRKLVKFAAIQDVHAASSLHSAQEVASWRIRTPPHKRPAAQGSLIRLQPPGSDELLKDDLGAVILRRGSTRQFAQVPISFAQLSTLLSASLPGSAGGISADFLYPPGSSLVTPYLIVNAVEGLEAGAYTFRQEAQALERLKSGEFRELAGKLALGQDLAGDASVNVYFLADLERVLNAFGNRGYRLAQLEAAILAGRMYLAAYAQRFGATGLTFFDDAVIRFFSPQAEGMSVMFLIALGKKARRK